MQRMRCGVCNYAPVAKTTTSIEEWDGDDLIVLKDVPVEKCLQCGEEYFAPETIEKLEAILAY